MATSNLKQNIPFVKQQFSAALGNSSVVVKFLCVSVVLGYLLSFNYSALNVLSVTPGNILPPNFWYWTLFTYPFVETHLWNVLVDIVIVILYGKLLEPLWGAKEMLVFFVVVAFVVAIASTLFYLCAFLVLRSPDYLFYTKICGLAGYVGAFSVAVKQTMPDHVLVNSPFGKLRNRHIPTCMFVCAIFARLIGIVMDAYPVMFGIGILTSWVYLRFYQKHSNGNKGDMAESFSFSSFFPEAFQPVVGVISNTLFSCLIKLKLCKKQNKYEITEPTTITVSLPGTDPQDAERRRQLALKALNERLSKVQNSAHDSEWPSLEQEDAESSAVSSVEPATSDSNTPGTHTPPPPRAHQQQVS